MGSNEVEKLTRGDDLRLFPKSRQVTLVPCYQVVCPGGVGAFQENIVVRVGRDRETPDGPNQMGVAIDELKEAMPQAFANLEFRTREDSFVFRENQSGYVQPRRPRQRQQENSALQTIRLQGRRNEDVGVQDQPESEHQRRSFLERAALMIRSI